MQGGHWNFGIVKSGSHLPEYLSQGFNVDLPFINLGNDVLHMKRYLVQLCNKQ